MNRAVVADGNRYGPGVRVRVRVLSHLLTLSAVVAGAARAEATGPTAVYPLSARLTVTSETRDRCLVRRDEACEVLLQDILQKTYESVLRRMFRAAPPDAPADLDITVSPAFADIIEGMGARQVVLETSVVIAAATTGEIDRLGCSAHSTVLGPEHDSVVNAAERASEEVAQDFERTFANSARVFNWLRGRGVEPVDSALSWPLRADWITFLDLGGGPVMGGGDAAAPGLLARFGIAGRWFIVQGIAGRWVPSFDAASDQFTDARASADLETTDLGIEAGPRLRLGNAVELRAGGGIHVLWGAAQLNRPYQPFPPASPFSRVTPTAFGAFQYTFWPSGSWIRIRTGIEVRKYLSTTVGFPELSRTIPIADTYVGMYLGFEVPLGSAPARGVGAAK